MTATGTLANLPAAPATAPPLPVSKLCVPKTGKPMSGFNIAPNGSGRLYIAYGPLTLNSTHLDPSADVNQPGTANYATKFDWYEFSASQTFFVSNVQAYMFGLPMQLLALDSGGRYYSGGFNNGYLNLISAFKSAPSPWNGLLLNKGGSPLRVLSPGNVQFKNYFKSFIPTLATFYNTQNQKKAVIVYAPQALTIPGDTTYGTCLAPPTPAPQKGNITPCPLYSVTHDSGGFEFALQKGAPALPKSVAFPKNVTVPDSYITNALTFGNVPPVPLPAVPTGSPTAAQWNAYLNGAVPFYLIKYLGNDLDRGVAMATPPPKGIVAHPVIPSCMAIDVSPPCIGSNYYPTAAGNVFDNYSAILHNYAVDPWAASMNPWSKAEPGGAYGSPYEDTWSQSSTVTLPYAPGPIMQWIKICVHPMTSSASGNCFK
jgi:Beta-1,3-glucanase